MRMIQDFGIEARRCRNCRTAGRARQPRPAVVIETDWLAPTDGIILCLATSTLRDDLEQRRVLVRPDPGNGLREISQFQIDRIISTRREKCSPVMGRLDERAMAEITMRCWWFCSAWRSDSGRIASLSGRN